MHIAAELRINPGLQTAHSVAPLQIAQLSTLHESQLLPGELGEYPLAQV